MTYADLIKLLEQYADKKVFFTVTEYKGKTGVAFDVGDIEISLSRKWGKDEIKVEII